jgi:hypothetical protein
MLFGSMHETQQDCITLHDIEYETFLTILEFLYTDQVRRLTMAKAVPLLIASEQFMLDRLKAM